MTIKELNKIAQLCFKHNLSSFTVIVAIHIAMDHCDDPDTIESYGIQATDSLRKLRQEIQGT